MNDAGSPGLAPGSRSREGELFPPPPFPGSTLSSASRRRPAEATLRIEVVREAIHDLETFIDSLDFASASERSRLKLAGSEIFDNLVKHSSPVEGGIATVRAARRAEALYLFFAFKSSSFGGYVERCFDHEPLFDRHARRWRGMGLRMTRNLSSSLRFRAGALLDRVIIRF